MYRQRSTKVVAPEVADIPGQSTSISYDRPDALRFYLQQAHKGHGATSKPRHYGHRLYRHGLRPKGFHDYNNIQWDPSIYRGRTFRDFREKNLPRFATTINMNKLCCTDCNKLGRGHGDVAVVPRKLKRVSLPRLKIGGIIRPTTDDIIGEDNTGRNHHKQDEYRREMEPFIMEQVVIRSYKDRGTRPDTTNPIPEKHCSCNATGHSVATQVQLSTAGTEDDAIKPIISKIGKKVLEQSLMEAIEEYEIHQIRTDINKFQERQRRRQRREMRVIENELLLREILESDRIVREKEFQQECNAQDVLGARIFALKFFSQLTTQVYQTFRRQNYFGVGNEDVENYFHPWLHNRVELSLGIPKRILNGIIREVETVRQTEALLYPIHRPFGDAEAVPEKSASTQRPFSVSGSEEGLLEPVPYLTFSSSERELTDGEE